MQCKFTDFKIQTWLPHTSCNLHILVSDRLIFYYVNLILHEENKWKNKSKNLDEKLEKNAKKVNGNMK